MSLYEFGRKKGIMLNRELEEDDEDEDESSDEEDATFEAMNHEPSIIEEENPQEDASPFMLCHEEARK